MTQTLHIFRKDIRRFRYELSAVGALTVAFAWSHLAANMPGQPEFTRTVLLAYLTADLLAVAWWFLVTQLIHEESLAGDRQFWIARPYLWRHLLAAKLLFVVVFVNVPLLAAQIVILAAAGYQPLAGLPRLLWMQLAVSVVLLVPAIALATVTRNLGQFVMSILCLVLCAYLAAAASHGAIDISSAAWPNRAVAVLIACVGAVLMVRWQYSRRLTDASILAGVCTLLLGGAFSIGLPIPVQYALRSWMLRPQETRTVSVSIGPSVELDHSISIPPQNPLEIVLLLPTTIAGIPHGDAARPEKVMVSFETPPSLRWSSGWRYTSRGYPISTPAGPEMQYQQLLILPRDVYRRIENGTVTIHGSMYLSLQKQTVVPLLPGSAPSIPGGGFCEVTAAGNEYALFCSSPFRSPYNSSSFGGGGTDRGAAGIERHGLQQYLSLSDSPWPDFALSPVFIERAKYPSWPVATLLREDPRAYIKRDFVANVYMPAAP
jgi:hypothetical protein